MSAHVTPRRILEELYPTLVTAARYARTVQARITELEEKSSDNIFGAALSEADLAVQNAVELAVLGQFGDVPFFGEEWKSSPHTKYLRGTYFVDGSEFLITLDPIDGTRPYIDGQPLYQIVLTVCTRDSVVGALVVYPAYGEFVYALRGAGAYRGRIGAPFASAERYIVGSAKPALFVAERFDALIERFAGEFSEIYGNARYAKDKPFKYISAALLGELSGAVLSHTQVIDSAALAFVAGELGFVVRTLEGKEYPAISDLPELVGPGIIVAENETVYEVLRAAVSPFLERR